MTVNEIIERIGYIRTRANLSARALSLAIGKTESYINRMEQKRIRAVVIGAFGNHRSVRVDGRRIFLSRYRQIRGG